jgi:hypothetical protein
LITQMVRKPSPRPVERSLLITYKVVYTPSAAFAHWPMVYGQWPWYRTWRPVGLCYRTHQRRTGVVEVRVHHHRSAMLYLGYRYCTRHARLACYCKVPESA